MTERVRPGTVRNWQDGGMSDTEFAVPLPAPREEIREIDPRLTGLLTTAGREWGPLGVALAAAELTDKRVLVRQIDLSGEEGNLVAHARRELELLGEEPEMVACLVRAVQGFASYPGHSGGSAAIAADMLNRLLRFENLSPLTDDPQEWQDQSEVSGSPLWQNRRNSAAMSTDGGRTYWIVGDDSATTHRSEPVRSKA